MRGVKNVKHLLCLSTPLSGHSHNVVIVLTLRKDPPYPMCRKPCEILKPCRIEFKIRRKNSSL